MSSSWNFSPAGSGVTTVGSIQPDTIDFSGHFARKKATDTDIVLVNTVSPLDVPETARFAITYVKNVYSGTGINAANQSQVHSGASILIQDNTVLMETRDDGTRIDYPFSAHLVLKVPFASVVDNTVLEAVLKRLLGFAYEQSGSSPGDRLNRLVRGALLPSALV